MKHLRQYIRQVLLEFVDDPADNVEQAYGWVAPQDARFGSRMPFYTKTPEPPPPDPTRHLGMDAYARTSKGKMDPVLDGVYRILQNGIVSSSSICLAFTV